MNKPKKEIQRKIRIMKKTEKDEVVPKRIDFFKFSLPYYRYYSE